MTSLLSDPTLRPFECSFCGARHNVVYTDDASPFLAQNKIDVDAYSEGGYDDVSLCLSCALRAVGLFGERLIQQQLIAADRRQALAGRLLGAIASARPREEVVEELRAVADALRSENGWD